MLSFSFVTFTIFAIAAFIIARLDAEWSLRGIVQLIQGVRDISQDWLSPESSAEMDNTSTLVLDDLNDDVLLEICSHVSKITEKVEDNPKAFIWRAMGLESSKTISALQSLSLTSKRLRYIAAPTLFRSIKIDGDWGTASGALNVVDGCPAILECVTSFSFKVPTRHDVGPKPPPGLPGKLVKVLTQMSNLQKLTITLPEYHTDEFATAFTTNSVSLSNVKIVAVGAFCDFVISHCPNIETIASSDGLSYSSRCDYDPTEDQPDEQVLLLIEAAGRARNVLKFEMGRWWSERWVQQVFDHMPNLRVLTMPGGDYADEPDKYLPIIKRFAFLEEVVLAPADCLNIGFYPPRCGNVYMGKGGAARRRAVEQQGLEAERSMADKVFDANRSIRTVWIGDYSKAEITRDDRGRMADLKWTYGRRETLTY